MTTMIEAGIIHEPFVVSLGGVSITGYGIAMVLAFVIAWVVIAHECGRLYSDRASASASEIVLAAAIGGLVGSMLSYEALVETGPLLTPSSHTFWGGLLGGACAYWVWTRWRRIPFAAHLDSIAIAIAAGYAVGRTGCWAVGDDYGRPWSGPLSVAFPRGAPPSTVENLSQVFGTDISPDIPTDAVIAVHPTQLYETFFGFLMFVALWRLRDHRQRRGWLFGLYCVLAGAERVLIEVVRVSSARTDIGLSVAQVLAIGVSLVGIALMLGLRRARPHGAVAS